MAEVSCVCVVPPPPFVPLVLTKPDLKSINTSHAQRRNGLQPVLFGLGLKVRFKPQEVSLTEIASTKTDSGFDEGLEMKASIVGRCGIATFSTPARLVYFSSLSSCAVLYPSSLLAASSTRHHLV